MKYLLPPSGMDGPRDSSKFWTELYEAVIAGKYDHISYKPSAKMKYAQGERKNKWRKVGAE